MLKRKHYANQQVKNIFKKNLQKMFHKNKPTSKVFFHKLLKRQ